MADLKITQLAALAGSDLAAGDLLAIADVSASETKKITVTDLVGNATTLIADATIPGAKILFGSNSVSGSALQNSSVDTTQLADDAVTAAKLGDESTVELVATLPASGTFVGQIALDTDDDKIYCWNGSQWVSVKGAGSVNSVVGSSAGVVNISVSTVGDEVTISTTLDNTTGAAQFLAGPTAGAGSVGYRTIAGGDLPTSTTTAKGGVVVNGNGLTMSGDTIAIDNTVTAEGTNYHVVQYDANGLVTAGRTIVAADVPVATSGTIGVVKPGSGLGVDGVGNLNHNNSIVAGTATKVTFDTEGHITASTSLADTDIPDLPATKITSGTFGTSLLASDAVTADKLADRSTAQFGDVQPTADYVGQLYFNSLTRDIYIWDSNVWQPIGISVGEIIFAGTFDASAGSGTGEIATVTSDGTAIGLVPGDPLPAAAAGNNRYYLVVSEAGTITSGNAPNVTLSPPDIILSNGTAWTEIDVSQTVTSQTAGNVSFSPAGNISATNVQAAIEELDTEKVGAASPTFTGDVTISTAGTLIFEGATADDYETILTVTDPTADRTITLPDVTGTVVTTGDTGTVSSTMLAGSIADSKLATISTADKVSISALNIDGATDIGAAIADTDLFIVDDGAGGTNRKAAASRLTTYAFGKVTGDITITSGGTAAIGSGVIVNADINAAAAISDTKLNTISTAGKVSNSATTATNLNTASAIVSRDAGGNFAAGTITADLTGDVTGNASTATKLNSARSFALTGDITGSVSSDLTGGVSITTSIGSGKIVNADINSSAAISFSKLASLTSGNILVGNGSNVPTSVSVSGDITLSNTGVASISSGVIVNSDISASAAITDTKLSTISTAGKVSNSATTATNLNTASAIVARNASGDFAAGTITADLTGDVTGNASTATKLSSTRSFALTGDITGTVNSDLTSGVSISTSIGSGVIVNGDISASAAIDDTKLSTISTAGKVSGSAITSGTIGGSTAINTTGTITTTGQTTLKEIKETVYTLGTSGSIALNPANGSIQSSVLTGAPTFTDSLQTGQTIVLHLENGATYTVTWPTITWVTGSGNAAPTLTAKDTLVIWKISTTLYGAYVGSYV